MARRSVFDPLEPTTEPRWYVVRNMHRAVLEARALPPGADLKRALVAAMLEHIDAGWQLGSSVPRAACFSAPRAMSGGWLKSHRAIRKAGKSTSSDGPTVPKHASEKRPPLYGRRRAQ
jgi:hypothetical protein